MKRQRFTLVELLVVCAIVIILAGLILNTVFAANKHARITRAKSEMASMVLAFRNAEQIYGSKVDAANNSFNGHAALVATSKAENDTWVFGVPESISGSEPHPGSVDAYDALIAELTVPEDSDLTALNINTQKRVLLEPREAYNPADGYTTQVDKLWRDPWGNPYVIAINVNGAKCINLANAFGSRIGSPDIATDIAIYSFGPNGADDHSCNADDINGVGIDTHRMHDDITSWEK